MSISKVLREHRIKSNLKLKDVSNATGLSVRCIQYIEKDERFPRKKTLEKLCEYYKIDEIS